MDPFSTAAAAVALIGQLDACSRSLRQFTRNLRMAKEEIRLLQLEVRSCREIAGLFYDAVAQYETTSLQKAQEKNIDQQLREQSQLAHQQIRAILCRLGPLTKKKETSAFERIRAHVRWHFIKNDTCLPLATLGCVKGSLTLLGQVVLLDWFVTNFSRIPESDSELKVQARSRIKSLRKQTQRADRELHIHISTIYDQGYIAGQSDTISKMKAITDALHDIKEEQIEKAREIINNQPSSNDSHISTALRERARGSRNPNLDPGLSSKKPSQRRRDISSPPDSENDRGSRNRAAHPSASGNGGAVTTSDISDESQWFWVERPSTWSTPDPRDSREQHQHDIPARNDDVGKDGTLHDSDVSVSPHRSPDLENGVYQTYHPMPPFDDGDYPALVLLSRRLGRKKGSASQDE